MPFSRNKWKHPNSQAIEIAGTQTRKIQEVRHDLDSISIEDEEDHGYYFLGECVVNNVNDVVNRDKWIINLRIGDTNNVKVKVDSGADVSVLDFTAYNRLYPKPELLHSDKKLITPAGVLNYIGIIKVPITYNGKHIEEIFFVMPKQQRTSNLLCRDVALKLGIVKFIGKVSLHDSLFGFGQWDTEPVKLCLKENAIPFAIHASRNIPFKLMEPVKKALNDMVEKDIIEVITSHTDWASAVVPVLKLDKKDVRICVDYRKLNNNLKREVFHIPTFDELSCKLSDVKYLTKLDAASGFFQIPLGRGAF